MIRPQDSLQLALRALGAHRLRSFLTLLGIAVGIAAVILLTSIGEGIHRFVLAEFTQFGTNVISVAPGRTKTAGHSPAGIPTSVRPLTLDDARALERLPHITGMTATVWGNSEVSANGRLRRTTINGVGAQMLKVFAIRVRSGQFLPADEAENARAFVVLGAKLKEELFGSANPLGARVRVGSLQFRVIGVLEAKGQILGFDLDDAAYIPTARALELYNRDGVMKVDLSYEADVPVAAVSARVRQALVARHGREDFTLTTQEDMLRTLSKILAVLTMAVGALGSISLLVGGVGIVTIMTIA
ncbi:MAG TPA: ABC transporter permease, partial [Accumulibacter sp.]